MNRVIAMDAIDRIDILIKKANESINKMAKELRSLEDKKIKEMMRLNIIITDLSHYKGLQIESFSAIDSKGKRVFLPDDEIISVDEIGNLYLSSFSGGIVEYCDELKSYSHSYHGGSRAIDIYGFYDVNVRDFFD